MHLQRELATDLACRDCVPLLQYGRIIIEEYYLPLHQKTLKPGRIVLHI
jgi:hypothetical protein